MIAGARVLGVVLAAPFWGAERMAVQTLRVLRDAGADVLVAVCDWEEGGIRRELTRLGLPYAEIEMRGHLTLRGRPQRVVRLLIESARSAWALRTLARNFRPTHIFAGDEASFLHAVPSIRALRPVTSIFSLPVPPDNNRPSWRRLHRLLWRQAIDRHATHLVANSTFTAGEVKRMLPGRPQVPVIQYCVPDRPDPGPANPAIDQVDIRDFNILYVGQIAEHKGVTVLVEAAQTLVRRHGNARVWLAGSPGALGERLRGQLMTAGLADRVAFLDEVADVPGLMTRASVHVMPSLWNEPFGVVLIEAKRAGVPSVVFPTGAWRETVRPGVDGIVCRDCSVEALVEGLEYFLTHPEERERAGRAARESAEAFSTDRFRAAWVDLVRRDLGSTPGH